MTYYREDIVKYEKVLHILIGKRINSEKFWNSTKTHESYIKILNNIKEYKEILEIDENQFDEIKSSLKEIINNFFNIIEKEKLKEFGLEFSDNISECRKLIEKIFSIEEKIVESKKSDIEDEFKFISTFREGIKLYQNEKSLLLNDFFREKLLRLCRDDIDDYSTSVMEKVISERMPKEIKKLKKYEIKTIPEAIFRRAVSVDVEEEEKNLLNFIVKEFYLHILCIVYKWGLMSKDIPSYLFEEIEELKWVKESLLDAGRRRVLMDIFHEHFDTLKQDNKNLYSLNCKNLKLWYKIEVEIEEVVKGVEKIFFKKEARIITKWKDKPRSLVKYMNESNKTDLYWNVEYLKKLLLNEIYILPVFQEYMSNAVKSGKKAFEIYEKKDNLESITENEKSSVKDWMIFFENARYSRSFFLMIIEKRLLELINQSMETDQYMFFYKLSQT